MANQASIEQQLKSRTTLSVAQRPQALVHLFGPEVVLSAGGSSGSGRKAPPPTQATKKAAYVQAYVYRLCAAYVRAFQASGPILGPRHVFFVRGDAPQTRRRNAYFQMCRVNA